jgi:hypothetical protein
MRLYALSAGVEATSRCFNGVIQSLFHHACNVRLDHDALLTLVSSGKGNLPNGIRLETPPGFTFLNQLRVGQPVACRGGILRISGSDLSVDLRTATPWQINLKSLPVDLHRPAQAQAWAVAWLELEAHWCGDGLSAMIETSSSRAWNSVTSVTRRILGQRGERTVPVLLEATGAFHFDHTVAALTPLIGLGPGLTPSGDDFLVGYLAGLWSTVGSDVSQLRFLTAIASWLTEAAGSTNTISSAYLQSAARGHVAEPIATLARELAHAESMEAVRWATRAALSVGHTSGADGVLGLLLGFLAWEVSTLTCRFRQPRLQRYRLTTPLHRRPGTDEQEVVEGVNMVRAATHLNLTQPVVCP